MSANRDQGRRRKASLSKIIRVRRVSRAWCSSARLPYCLQRFSGRISPQRRCLPQCLATPSSSTSSEGMIVAETMLLDKGVAIYDKPTADLFIAAPYPPLFYLLAWPAQHLLGSEPSFKIGRALSIFATLLAGLCLFGIVRAQTRDWLAGSLAAALWWSLGLVAFWGQPGKT